jgi:UDP-3-O-[3-hydroxymyristoyl] glucosamine N-acyltransferase
VAFTMQQLADLIQGELVGDGGQIVQAARPLLEARPGDITFIEDEKYLQRFYASGATGAIVSLSIPVNGKPMIRVKEPRTSFSAVYQRLHSHPSVPFIGIHPTAWIDPSAVVASDASIGPHVSVGAGCVIGPRCRLHSGVVIGNHCVLKEDVVLHPHVVLYDGCIIGNRVIVHANAVLGADGYGYRQYQGRHIKIPQIGIVEVEDDVEVGACTTIDRATFGTTRIGEGTKIDNLVQVGHNCQIGRHNILCSQVGIAGSVTTADHVVMAGQVGVCDHLTIGERAQLGPQAGITKDVPQNVQMWGSPAVLSRDRLREITSMEKLAEMRKDLKKIKKQLGLDEPDE